MTNIIAIVYFSCLIKGGLKVEWWILYLILAVVIAIVVAAFFIIRKRLKRKMDQQQTLVNQQKVPASILVLEKRKDKITNANIPKSVLAQIPKIYKIRKVPLIKAKIGQQVIDLICDEDIFDKIPDKKTVRVELAGIFIAGILPTKR